MRELKENDKIAKYRVSVGGNGEIVWGEGKTIEEAIQNLLKWGLTHSTSAKGVYHNGDRAHVQAVDSDGILTEFDGMRGGATVDLKEEIQRLFRHHIAVGLNVMRGYFSAIGLNDMQERLGDIEEFWDDATLGGDDD